MNEQYNDNQHNENTNANGVNFTMTDSNTNENQTKTSSEQNVAQSREAAADTTYHRSYINQNDPNATTYVNGNSTTPGGNASGGASQSGAPIYATYTPGGSDTQSSQNYYGNTQNMQGQNMTNQQEEKEYPYANHQTYAEYTTKVGNGAATSLKTKPKKEHKVWKFVGKAVAFGAIAGCVMIGMTFAFNRISGTGKNGNSSVATTTTTSGTVKTTSTSSKSGNTVSSIAKDVMPSIVSITSTFQASNSSDFNNFYYWFYGGNDSSSKEQTGSGSGIIISETDSQLMIVTNNHVISDTTYGDATKVQVTFSNDKIVEATVKGTDSDADLAVLTVNKSDLDSDTLKSIKIAVIGDSDSMSVGDDVVAIGNALGYGQSVTTGVVSALNREVQLEDKTMTLLQTDAAINPGNSGGALLNMNGELIGINSVKYASDAVEGMGYAIPMQIAQPIVEELMNEEAVEEGEEAYLGVYGNDISSDLSSVYNMPEGVWVKNVTDNSPAEKAGIQQRDIITKFNKHNITSMSGLQEQIARKKAGTKVTITVQRQGSNGEYKEVELQVTLGKKSEAATSTENNPNSNNNSQDDDQSQGNGWDDFFNR